MKNNITYPKQGDIIVIDAEPHAGREYGGHNPKRNNIRRHLVVVSNTNYNRQAGFIVGMPITTSDKYAHNQHYLPILVPGTQGTGVKGYICLWQVQNFDFKARNGIVVNHVSHKIITNLVNFYVEAIYELDS